MNWSSSRSGTILNIGITIFIVALMCCFPATAQVIVGGVLTQNTTFIKANNPYIVSQELTVPAGITLTIEPGTELHFSSDTRLTVHGNLIARGNVNDSIYFRLYMQIPNQNLWNGIVFDSAQTIVDSQGNYISGTILSFASIYNTNYSVTVKGNAGVLIEKSLIRQSSYGLYLNDAEHCIIRNCRITQTGFGVFIPSGITARYNNFEDNDICYNFTIGLLINNSQGKTQKNRFTGNKVRNNYIGMFIGNDGLADIGLNFFNNNYITQNTLEGVRIYQDSTLFYGNYLLGNGTGIELRHTDNSIVSGNLISGNSDWGIRLSDSATRNLVEKNILNKNGGGIRIGSEGNGNSLYNSFLHNTLYQNSGRAFLIEDAPQGDIHFNNFNLNGDTYSFINNTPELIHAENNWWGTTLETHIDSLIYDILDKPELGLVQYKIQLAEPDTIAPIMAPRNVVKRQVGDDVLVSWDPVNVGDLGGYYVYFGTFNGYTFTNQIDAGLNTSYILPAQSVIDSIAVSAFDINADGFSDQTEGHESEYVFALLSPYAGPDTTICSQSYVLLDKATAFNYEYIDWETSGDGTFNGSHTLKPRYYPGPQDYANTQVLLTLTVSGVGYSLYDQTRISFSQPPSVFAGNDTIITTDTVYHTSTAVTSNTLSIFWESMGDGIFDNENELITVYHPGMSDLAAGRFILALHVSSVCGDVTDSVEIILIKSYVIKGRVHAGNELAAGSQLDLYSLVEGEVKPVRSAFTSTNGFFTLGHVVSGEYYVYAIPDIISYPGYAPAYYVDKLHWKDAYKLTVAEDTYDIDIDLAKFSMLLPVGEGRISGNCFSSGSSGQACGNIAVLLFDKTGTYLLGWTWVQDDGSFNLPDLPYGDYVVVGEKAGYERFFSQVISISPEHPTMETAELHIVPNKISFFIPPGEPPIIQPIIIYPNPVNDILYFGKLPNTGLYTLTLTNCSGKSITIQLAEKTGQPASLDISKLPPGLYLLRIYSGDTFLQMSKVIRQ